MIARRASDSSLSAVQIAYSAMHKGAVVSSCRPSRDQKALQQLLKGNYGLLSPEEKRMASTLVAAGQQHLFQHWPAPGARTGVDLESRILLPIMKYTKR